RCNTGLKSTKASLETGWLFFTRDPS
ncbi:F0F1 ATP synthase subunit epsilon, partial [Shigella sonnei]|nr:F0F1 ATP synthase subunit epsilon [Shigella sonnei]